MTPEGILTYTLATQKGPDDDGTFAKFEQNIVVGIINPPTLRTVPGQGKIVSPGVRGAVLYNTNDKTPVVLNESAIRKILNK